MAQHLNMVEIDYTKKELLILAFDHRSSFTEKLFGIKGRPPSSEEKRAIAEYKRHIYDGFTQAVASGIPKQIAGLLVDEEFGTEVAREAIANGYNLAMAVEKSGQDEFDFEYGQAFREHIESFRPTFSKVLVRYNPEGDKDMNRRQLSRLKILSDYLHISKRPFIFELLVPATKDQLARVKDSKEQYDTEIRPKLMVIAMREIQQSGVEPDIWKLEGVERDDDARGVVRQAQTGGRKAGVITLGRGESKEMVAKWLKVGAKIPGIIGFAVGRTIFWEPLSNLRGGEIDRKTAVDRIAQNYIDFANLWLEEKKL